MKLFSEIRRRRVFPTLLPYLGLVWLILQVISVINPLLNLNPLVGTFITVLLFAGFPVMVYLSWYFDFTTEGLKLTEVTEGEIAPSFGWPHRLILAAIVLISGALGYLYFQQLKIGYAKYDQGIESVRIARSIAVIPFKDQSPDQDQAYLAEGLAEELSSLLGRLSELEVAATSSTFALSGMQLMPQDIGRRLNVETILTGSIRVTGNKLKLRSELVDVDTGKILWTENFSREFSNIFQVEEEISRSIVNLLQDIYVAPAAKDKINKTASSDAYVIYLKGREQYRLQTTEGMKQARKYFEQAIALDPEYVDAYVGAADATLMLEKGNARFGTLEPEIATTLAEKYLAKALVRDSNLAEAYAMRGKALDIQFHYDEALGAYDKAIALNPSLAIAHMWRYGLLKRMGRFSESMEALETAYKLDPISVATTSNRAIEYSRRGRYEEAVHLATQLINDFPHSPMGHAVLADAAFLQGELAISLEEWGKAYALSKENHDYQQRYVNSLITLGFIDEAKKISTDPYYDAAILLIQGDYTALIDKMNFDMAANPDDPWVKFEAVWHQALVGDKEVAIKLLLEINGQLSKEEEFQMPMCSPAIEIAWALKQQQKITEAQAMLKGCIDQLAATEHAEFVDSFRDHLRARIAALRNQPEAAIAALKLAIEHGWREWWTAKDPLLSELPQTPELAKLYQYIDQQLEIEKQKAKLYLSASEDKTSQAK
jgi:TolB-like protein